MTMKKDETYFVVRNKDGDEYLCPLNSVENPYILTEDELDDCVEEDIVERNSGNFNIKPC